MAVRLKASHIVLLSLVLSSLLALGIALSMRQSDDPSPLQEHAAGCQPLPANIEHLGPSLRTQDGLAALAKHGQSAFWLRSLIRPGDTILEFRTGVTGGHLVMRGRCFIGQDVAWIR